MAIMGSGAAGLWLAHELTRRGYSVAVLDRQPFCGFASTRNQGWLQSGALYAAYGSTLHWLLSPDMVNGGRYPCPGTPAIADLLQAASARSRYMRRIHC